MTTEIAVINRLGVALAADSAVTIPGYDSDKVFDTGDKLFELSELHPVALMVNGSMDFLGVPWELIAKEFRCTPPEDVKTIKMKEWMDRFLSFLANHQAVKPDDVRRWQDGLIAEELEELAKTVRDRLEKLASEDGDENLQAVVRRLYTEIMTGRIEKLLKKTQLDSLADMTEDDVLPTVRSIVAEIAEEDLPFKQTDEQTGLFNRLITLRLLRDMDRLTSTGLILGGFGGKDLFPSLYAVEIDGYIAGSLRYSMSHDVTIARGEAVTGIAISFAQTDVVDRLLKGTDNRFVDGTKAFIKKNVAGTFEQSFARLKLRIVRADGEEIPASEIGGFLGNAIAQQYEITLVVQLKAEFQRKFNATIALMPKQDLIELAEALVNITAIERKASDDAGTVGGPIDVALITRAEGFVWIKRKHHFTADLNPRYMWRRFQAKVAAESEDAKTQNK